MFRTREALAIALALLIPALLLVGCPSANPPDGNGDGPDATTFTLTVHPVGNGAIESEPHAIDCPGACDASFDEDTTVHLIAYPHAGATFQGWTGDHDCLDGIVTLTRDTTCTALFPEAITPSHPLEVQLLGEGSVTSNPSGIDCPSGACIALYPHGTLVTLTPNADDGHTFDGWHGDEDCSDGQVTLTGAVACIAAFEPTGAPSHVLDVTLTGGGAVTSSPSGIDCPTGACHALYDDGTVVTLTATPDAGYAFSGWSGDPDCGDGRVTLTGDRACTATFTPTVATYDLTITRQGNGTVTSSPAGITCGATCQTSFTDGATVALTATPDGGHTFTGWGGDPDCGDGHVSMTSDIDCSAAFAEQEPENQPPDLAPLADQDVLIGDDLDVTLTVQDETPETLAFAVTTSDPNIVSPNDIQVFGTGGTRTLRITPTPCHAGTTTITVTASDVKGVEDTESFDLHVHRPFRGLPSRLEAIDGVASDRFGLSVAIDGDVVLVGAPYDDWNGLLSGSVYAYQYDGGGWPQTAHFVSIDAGALDWFGRSVAMDGGTAIVGAPYHDAGAVDTNEGAAYVFEHTASGWSEVETLSVASSLPNDGFGTSVAIHGDLAIVGAPGHDHSAMSADEGAAYVVQRMAGGWAVVAKLTAGNAADDDQFGLAVAIDGAYAIVGAPYHDAGAADTNEGAAYIFQHTASGWSEVAALTADNAAEGDQFGHSVAIDGDLAVVGAPYRDHVVPSTYEGAAYLFRREGGVWTQVDALTASDASSQDHFGASVDVDGGYVVIGAYGNDVIGTNDGSAYVFQSCSGQWKETAKLFAPGGADNEHLGRSVSIDGERVIAGAFHPYTSLSVEGAAYVFDR